ncbi:hypothetical protein ACFFX0_00545 [Citricoccus parietis]|uniref:Uncharacterized protein n=1 Tax=Citricoccus parietis TaxID=592307 RepID=A0ABV5FSX3_9MICC
MEEHPPSPRHCPPRHCPRPRRSPCVVPDCMTWDTTMVGYRRTPDPSHRRTSVHPAYAVVKGPP